MGVWVSGGAGAADGHQHRRHEQQQPPGRRPLPLGHPYLFSACLRFLLGFRGGEGAPAEAPPAGGGAPKAVPASPSAFLVLCLPGGVGGGTPTCFEACALHAASPAAPAVTRPVGADGGGLISVSSVGFELLDFSADVDAVVGGSGTEARRPAAAAAAAAGAGGGSVADRAVVIGKLRRVSSLSAAGGAFGRALARERGRWVRGDLAGRAGLCCVGGVPTPRASVVRA